MYCEFTEFLFLLGSNENLLVWLTGNHNAQLSCNCSNQTLIGNNNSRQKKLVIKRSVQRISNDLFFFFFFIDEVLGFLFFKKKNNKLLSLKTCRSHYCRDCFSVCLFFGVATVTYSTEKINKQLALKKKFNVSGN